MTLALAAALLVSSAGQRALRVPTRSLARQRAGLLRLPLQGIPRHHSAACRAEVCMTLNKTPVLHAGAATEHGSVAPNTCYGACRPGGACS